MCPAIRHDTTSAYRRHGCRCPEAVELMRQVWRRRYLRRADRVSHRHGTVDEVAVYRAMHGEPLDLTVDERRAAAARMTELGLTGRQIGDRLGVTRRTVQRYRTIHNLGTQPVDKVAANPVRADGDSPQRTVAA